MCASAGGRQVAGSYGPSGPRMKTFGANWGSDDFGPARFVASDGNATKRPSPEIADWYATQHWPLGMLPLELLPATRAVLMLARRVRPSFRSRTNTSKWSLS